MPKKFLLLCLYDGDEYCVDTLKIGLEISREINIKAIKKYIEEREYKNSDILQVSNGISRLTALFPPTAIA